MTEPHLLPTAYAAIAAGRREARRIVNEPGQHSAERRLVAWAALVGQCPHPQARRQCVNLGAPAAQQGWHKLATVIEGGAP